MSVEKDRPSLCQVRVTGVLIERGKILLVRQSVSPAREWSLPGGKLERGETLQEAMQREMIEETGLATRVERLLYLCELPEATPPLLHVTFLLERTGGVLSGPSDVFEQNPIQEVKMVPIEQLADYGFTERFQTLVAAGFPNAGSYAGHKSGIGLD